MQCPELIADATSDTRPTHRSAESNLLLWDLLLRKRRAVEHHEQSLQEAQQRLKDPYLLSHELDFFTSAEAEVRNKLCVTLDEFWAVNVPDPARLVSFR